MATLSEFFKFWNAKDATGVAADLDSGKIMYNDSGKITGTKVYSDYFPLPSLGSCRLYGENPLGQTKSANYNPKLAYPTGAVIIQATGWSTIVGNSGFDLSTDGLSKHASLGYPDIWRCASGPAWSGSLGRLCEMSGVANAQTDNDVGLWIAFNLQDVSTDYWQAALRYLTATGAWRLYLAERVASVTTNRGTYDFSVNIDAPCHLRLGVYDYGDYVCAFGSIWEYGTSDVESAMLEYDVASRPLKSSTGIKFATASSSPDSKWRNFKVTDL